jgi:hypothetical protein
MYPFRGFASCAVAALAMVFSVQQGPNGPLVVFQPKESESAWVVGIPAATSREEPATLDLATEDGIMTNARTGESLTLKAISDDLSWRRDTAEKLRQVPVGPRF